MDKAFKYKINELIDSLPRTITIAHIEHILKSEHKVSRDMFYRDRNLLLTDDGTIPSGRLFIYAALLNSTADDLKNYKEPKIKALVDRKPTELFKKIAKRTGLKK